MNPFKLSLVTLGCAGALAAAPQVLRMVFPPTASLEASAAGVTQSDSSSAPSASTGLLSVDKSKITFPGKSSASKSRTQAKASTPTLPKPSGAIELPAADDAMPEPKVAVPAATPTPKPEIPYRAEVAHAQDLLAKLGYSIGVSDGKLGQKTEVALTNFQKKYSLKAYGEANKETLTKLESEVVALSAKPAADPAPEATVVVAKVSNTPVPGADDPSLVVLRKSAPVEVAEKQPAADPGPVPSLRRVSDVTRIQEALIAAKVYGDAPDGKWGHKTIVAMTEFQQKNNLKATGKPNKETWAKLYETKLVGENEAPAVPPAKGTLAAVEPKSAKPSSKNAIAAPQPIDVIIGPKEKQETARTNDGQFLIIADSKAATGDPGDSISIKKPNAAKAAVAESQDVPSLSELNDNLEISKPGEPAAEAPAAPKSADPVAEPKAKKDVVVAMNVDAGLPDSKGLKAPAAVGDESAKSSAAPEPFATKEDSKSAKPEARKRTPAQQKELEKELAEAQARVAMMSSDSRYEMGKYAPQVLDSVNSLVGKVQRDIKSDSLDSAAAHDTLKSAERELDKAKQQSLGKKAEAMVAEVDKSYKTVKARFSSQLKKAPLSEKMALIDKGYEAMKVDYKKGNYDPIIERCEGFKLSIENINDEAAKAYVDEKLASKSARRKISKAKLKDIEALQKQNKYDEAAEILLSATGKRSGDAG